MACLLCENTPVRILTNSVLLKKITHRFDAGSNDSVRSGVGRIVETLIESAVELGIEPDEESTPLYDVLDAEALEALSGSVGCRTDDHLQISFLIWGVHFLVTPQEVIATPLR
ncbi:hypothetical protein GJR96_16575 [Haloferax sp. MBLA0076]|uniref:Halobacterial output domain-containing protein n=1 Tax=Haloferax litoreum TaxID=2666140 RepID=A0A6A8GL95_9EURY|nr:MULTISPECIES: hypothetical protein [Haloferax]KAB1190574.1 hypothetical protein Hfx1148_16520 [Haloferax sp. CBA1148]MRX23561.1 hypothetical protein [Haloferax litoreum]